MLCRLVFSFILAVNYFNCFCCCFLLGCGFLKFDNAFASLFTSTIAENWKITLAAMIQKEIYQSCCRPSWQGILMFSGRKACKTDMGYKVVRITYWLYFMLFCKLKGPILTTNTYRLHLWCFCLTLYLILIQRYVSCHLQQVFALG